MTLKTLSIPLTLALVCGAASQLAAQSAEQQQERLAVGFVRQVAEGDADATLDYIQSHFSAELLERRPADDWRSFAGQLERHAGLEIAGIFIDQPGHVVVEAASPAGMTVSFGFDFTPGEPDKIAGLSLEAGRGQREQSKLPPFEPPPGAGVDPFATALGTWLDALGRDQLFSGAVLVALHGEPIYSGAWGLASREWNAPNGIDTRFGLGSINKSFTKIAIAQLVLAGVLSLDDTIADHLPDYPNPEVARKVTIRHLVEHSSGIGDIFNERFFNSSRALYREPADFFPVFADQPLLFEPGTSSAYSNGGYMVLGAIIAAASGRTYSDYVEEKILEPAGMTATGFFARDEIHPDVAVGYTRMGPEGPTEELRNNLFLLAVRGSSAGNAYATVADMLAFDNALRDHRLLPPAWTNWYFGGGEPGEGEPEVSAARAGVATAIAGGAPGVSAVLESDGTLTVVVLSNHDEPGAEAVARALRRPLARLVKSAAQANLGR